MKPRDAKRETAGEWVLGIIKETNEWLAEKEPELHMDMEPVIIDIVEDIGNGADPIKTLDKFEDWVEEMLRMFI